MPKIPQYTAQVEPQGGLATRQAQPSDFGGDQGFSELGQGLQGAASIMADTQHFIKARDEQQDVTNVRVDRAKAQAEWDQKFIDFTKNAPLGDPTIRDKFMEAFNEDAQKRRSIAQTVRGQQVFDETHATLMQHFNQRAVQFQSASAGLKAKQDYATEIQSLGATISSAQSVEELNSKYNLAIEMATRSIKSEDGIYARAGRAVQDDLLNDARREFTTYRMTAMVEIDPKKAREMLIEGKVDSAINPTVKLELIHKANAKILANENRSIQDNARKIGNDALNEAASRQGIPTVGETPSVSSVANTVANSLKSAIYGQESSYGRADTSRINSQGVTGPMQVQDVTFLEMKRLGIIPTGWSHTNPEQNKIAGERWVEHLLKKHNGDPARAAAEYYSGPTAVNADGSINRHFRNLKNPNDPTVGQYVDQVLSRMGTARPEQQTSRADFGATRGDALKIADEQLKRQYVEDSPQYRQARDLTFSHIQSYYSQQEQALRAKERKDYETVMKEALGNKPTSPEQLGPEAQQAFARLPASTMRGVLALFDHNAKELDGKGMKSLAEINQEVFERIHLPVGDPNKITQPSQLAPYFARGLTRGDYDWHVKLINATPEGQRLAEVRARFFAGMKNRFDKSTMTFSDPRGGEDFFQFQQYVIRKEQQYAAENKDPYLLYDPRLDNKEYIGNSVDQFQRNMQDRIRFMSDSIRGVTGNQLRPPSENSRKPGETIDQWKKRTNQ